MHRMACSHAICVECACKMQSNSMNLAVYPLVSTISRVPDYEGYKIKYHLDGYKMIRVNHFMLQGYKNTMKCPYCRKDQPILYDFDEIRFLVPSFTSEWNMFEHKLQKQTSFTISKDGSTFAFKLSRDKSYLHVMWSEINTYAYTIPSVAYKQSKDKFLHILWTEFNIRELQRKDANHKSTSKQKLFSPKLYPRCPYVKRVIVHGLRCSKWRTLFWS